MRAFLLRAGSVAIASIALGHPGTAAARDDVTVGTRHSGSAGEQRILDYWTPKRIRHAKPLGLVLHHGSGGSRRAPRESGRPSYVLPAAPGASPRRAHRGVVRTPSARRQPRFTAGAVPDTTTFPNTTNGKIYGHIKGIGNYECSGTVVDSPNLSVVFTAGHCVAERGRLANKLVFIPSFQRAQPTRPFGTWVFHEIVVTDQWAQRGNFNYDYSAVILSPQNGVPVQQAVGARGIGFFQPRNQDYQAFGYPFNRQHGETMWNCASHFLRNDPHPAGGGPLPFGIGCDMGAGASGGGWVIAGNVLNSVSSFGYDPQPEILYGSYFGGVARRIYNTAAAAPTPS